MIGGEGPADPTWLVANTETMVNAAKYNALVVMVEHRWACRVLCAHVCACARTYTQCPQPLNVLCCRFYGASHPTPDLSLSSLKFLSSQQALADLAYFHSFAVDKFHLTAKNKWVSSGGSYPGER